MTSADRKKDMVLVSGFNVYPNEVEDVVMQLPGVAECAVVGVPDDKTGEAVKLVIVKRDPTLTEEKVKEFCRTDRARHSRWRRRAFRSPLRLAKDLRAGRHHGDPEHARLLAAYLEANAAHLYTFRSMGPGHWLRGSGPVEKHVELTVNRRFKRRGMRWSRRGARRLLAIRLEVIASR